MAFLVSRPQPWWPNHRSTLIAGLVLLALFAGYVAVHTFFPVAFVTIRNDRSSALCNLTVSTWSDSVRIEDMQQMSEEWRLLGVAAETGAIRLETCECNTQPPRCDVHAFDDLYVLPFDRIRITVDDSGPRLEPM